MRQAFRVLRWALPAWRRWPTPAVARRRVSGARRIPNPHAARRRRPHRRVKTICRGTRLHRRRRLKSPLPLLRRPRRARILPLLRRPRLWRSSLLPSGRRARRPLCRLRSPLHHLPWSPAHRLRPRSLRLSPRSRRRRTRPLPLLLRRQPIPRPLLSPQPMPSPMPVSCSASGPRWSSGSRRRRRRAAPCCSRRARSPTTARAWSLASPRARTSPSRCSDARTPTT